MRPPVLTVCWLVLAGIVWVVATDWAVAVLAPDGALRTVLTAAKDMAFLAVGGLAVYRLLARHQAERQAAEAAFGESERGFQSLFKNNPLPIWAYDRETLRFLEINDVALAKYGYSREELLTMTVTDVHPPDEVPRLLAAIITPRQVREVSGVWNHRLKDGRVIEVDVQVQHLELHGRPARVVVALDVTERRRSERRFRELVDGLKAIDWEADPATYEFRFVGQRAEALLGYSLADWASDGDMLDRCVPADDRDKVRTYLSAIAEGRPAISCEVRARTADSRMLWLRIDGAAHIDDAGQVTHMRGLVADVTGERDRAKRAARGEKLRALGQLSSGVAHDLNQSLALIVGYGELLQAMLVEQPDAVERLPAAPAPLAPIESTLRASTPTALRCLVVDDEPQLARMLCTMLRRFGHLAQPTFSGDEALAVLAGAEFDLLVTDVGVGRSMKGWELADRALQLRPGLPVIVASGWGATIDPEVARGRGIVGILSKPYRIADLGQVLLLVPPRPESGADTEPPPQARAS